MSFPSVRHVTPSVRVFAGEGALAALPREFDRAGIRRAVVFCGASMRRHTEAVARVESALGDRLAGWFDGVREHSPLPAVEHAREVLEATGADAVVALGGGSAIVTGRAASILLAEKVDVRDVCTRRVDGRLVSPKLDTPKIPQWIIPSTPTTAYAKAGSAVRDPETGERLALFDPKTRAAGVFMDPVIAGTAPVSLVRSSALNAFAMAVDGLQSDTDDPLADALLAYALRLSREWLPRLDVASDGEPRLRLMFAALLAGQGSDHTGAGLAQALSHAVGPRSTVANGTVEAMLLPPTMRFNAQVTKRRLVQVAEVLSGGHRPDDGAAEAIDAVERLLAAVGVPRRLRDVGVDRAALPEIIEHAMDDWAVTRVPRPATREDLEALLDRVW
ncbi:MULTISPECIES: iron-containing alcohol dehydrogenase family protein [unclassified Parafrankia]|uniref:iron-containing alcohol dehydrogenase family protein n=1 Tax=unclassified Parafrankia TaxID=2994368 RepID=UPI000DA5CFCC|nr:MULTISPECIES: iron-containing alcohol dehydrogenase family protein [unclassified Parafrankia]TCJ31295.1 iron-containing alcohol dehydrogenase [Parafrankia sp. BMG5.11]SQD95376.1 Iron-containing alcohol dehydrogenase [Parafrankia sp. Ea1.12]